MNWKKEILENLILIGIVVAVVLLINHFLVINATIPSASMENTVMTHDRIFGNRLAYRSKDIVIFRYPDDETELYIKRIIGLPGETVKIVDGKVYINGSSEPLDDSFCAERPTGSYGPIKVPENCYFMMGDNRNNSHDSRFWDNHYVAREKILGKAVFRYWPLNRIGLVK